MSNERKDLGNRGNGSGEPPKKPYTAEEVISILEDFEYGEVEIPKGKDENSPRRWIFTDKHDAPRSLRSGQFIGLISESKTSPNS